MSRNSSLLLIGCLLLTGVGGAWLLHVLCGWSWLLVAALAVSGLVLGITLYWYIDPPAKEIIDVTQTTMPSVGTQMPTIKDPTKLTQREFDYLVRQYPEAWQYCRVDGVRTLHVKNQATGAWECAACLEREAERQGLRR